jgi:hypothetical protein
VSGPVALASLPLLLAAASTPASDPPVIVLEGPPDVLAALAASGQVTGTVASGDAQGALVLLTALGALSIKNAAALAVGASLVVQPLPDRSGTVLILAIDDVATSPRTAPAAALPSVAQSAAPPPPAFLDFGTTVTATVLATVASAELPPTPEAAPGPTPSAATGSPVAPSQTALLPAALLHAALAPVLATAPVASPLSTAVPHPPAPATATLQTLASVPAPAFAGPPPSTPGSAAPPPSGTVVTVPTPALGAPADKIPSSLVGAVSPTLPPGTNVTVRILAVQPAPTPQGTTQPALTGTVVASPAGERALLVETPAGIVRLFAATPATTGNPVALPLAPGTPVGLRLVAEAPAGGVLTVLRPQAPAAASAAPATPAPVAASQGVQATIAPSAAAIGATKGAPESTAPQSAAPQSTVGEPTQAAPLTYRVALADATAPKPAGGAPVDPRATPQPIIGTVLPNRPATAAAATVIATPLGTLAVTAPLALPAGTLLLLVPQEDAPSLVTPALDRPTRLDKGWPALEATLATLGQAAPELAAHLRTDFSAQSGERLAAGLMFLVAALQSGPARAWPGDAVEHALALGGRSDLKLRLGEEFAEIRGIADNPATGAWQVFLLPLIEGAAVRPVRLYLKRRGERGRRAASEDNARFILEFELTRLGMLQLDGFVRPQRFDLVLRSHAALDAPLRAGVERIFYQRVGAAGLAGTIDFATASRFDVAPLDKLRGAVGLAV